MKIYTPDTLPSTGRMLWIYSDPGVGKTTSVLKSAPRPIIYLACEPRNPSENIRIAELGKDDILILIPETWQDLLDTISNMIMHPEGFPNDVRNYKTLFVDGVSHLMNVFLSNELEDESFDARDAKDKLIKPLINSAKLSLEGYGGLASQMHRFTKLIGRLSAQGMVVIVASLAKTQPKWDRDISVGPNLKGKEFPLDMPGSFDIIGWVQTRRDEAGRIVYPPIVSFREGEGYMAKFCGLRKGGLQGPLDVGKILAFRDKMMGEAENGKDDKGNGNDAGDKEVNGGAE